MRYPLMFFDHLSNANPFLSNPDVRQLRAAVVITPDDLALWLRADPVGRSQAMYDLTTTKDLAIVAAGETFTVVRAHRRCWRSWQLEKAPSAHSSGSPALRKSSITIGGVGVASVRSHLIVSCGLRRRASAKADFSTNGPPSNNAPAGFLRTRKSAGEPSVGSSGATRGRRRRRVRAPSASLLQQAPGGMTNGMPRV